MRQFKYLHYYVLPLFIFCSCGQGNKNDKEKSKNNFTEESIQTEYQPIDIDTIVTEKALSMYNELYNLKMIQYCLNDSAIINEIQMENENAHLTKKTISVSHNYSAKIILIKNNKEVFTKQITKDIFKDSLQTEFLKTLTLREIQYDFVRTNRLYFKANLIALNTGLVEEFRFAIYYQTEKIGQLDFWRENFNH